MLLNYFKILFSFIKNHYRLVIIGYALVATLFVFLLMNKNWKLSDENERYYINQISLTEDIETYKTESGKNAVKITELTLSRNEFEIVCKEQVKTIVDVFSPKDKPSKIIYKPEKPIGGGFLMDISNAIEELGYKPEYDCKKLFEAYKREMELNRFKELLEK